MNSDRLDALEIETYAGAPDGISHDAYGNVRYDTQAYDTTTGSYYDDMGGYNG